MVERLVRGRHEEGDGYKETSSSLLNIAGLRLGVFVKRDIAQPTEPHPSRWIREGTADQIITEKRAHLASRQERARESLEGFDVLGDPRAGHLWLSLPDDWRSDQLVQHAEDRGVRITGAEAFSVTRSVPAGVRLSLGRPRSLEEMAAGIEDIREILEEGPVTSTTVI